MLEESVVYQDILRKGKREGVQQGLLQEGNTIYCARSQSEHFQRKGTKEQQTCLEKIFIAGNASTLMPAHLNSAIEHLTQAVHSDDNEAIIAHLQRLIPEFQRTKV